MPAKPPKALKSLKLEKQILFTGTVFSLSLFVVTTISIDLFGIGLPTCITDVKPFKKSEILLKTPTQYEVHWVASMWRFDPAEMTIPANTDLDIYLSTTDVTHGFLIDGTNVNLLAVPGAVNYAHVRFTEPGDYSVICHEYCGAGHQNMSAVIHVTSSVAPPVPVASPSEGLAQAGNPGYRVMQDRGCLACHTITGQPGTGPTFKGLYGSQVKLVTGQIVKADDEYIRNAIRHPRKDIAGFNPVMPTIPLTDAEVEEVVEFIKTLK